MIYRVYALVYLGAPESRGEAALVNTYDVGSGICRYIQPIML